MITQWNVELVEMLIKQIVQCNKLTNLKINLTRKLFKKYNVNQQYNFLILTIFNKHFTLLSPVKKY